MKYGKIWGTTRPLLQTPFVEVHHIEISKGGQCSYHHKYALEDITYLTDGEYTTVSPTEKHYFKAVSDVEALEIYYPEPLSEDILRENVGRIVQDSYKLDEKTTPKQPDW